MRRLKDYISSHGDIGANFSLTSVACILPSYDFSSGSSIGAVFEAYNRHCQLTILCESQFSSQYYFNVLSLNILKNYGFKGVANFQC